MRTIIGWRVTWCELGADGLLYPKATETMTQDEAAQYVVDRPELKGWEIEAVMLKHGDAVEVNQVWAYAHPAPLKRWFDGYEFVRMDGDVAIVKHTTGLYAGIEVRYPKEDVRVKQ